MESDSIVEFYFGEEDFHLVVECRSADDDFEHVSAESLFEFDFDLLL